MTSSSRPRAPTVGPVAGAPVAGATRCRTPARMPSIVVSWSRHPAPRQLAQHLPRRLRVPERGRADLDRVGPRSQQLHRVAPRLHPADPDDRGLGERGPALPDRTHGHRVHRRPREPAAAAPGGPGEIRSRGRRRARSRVFTRVNPSAPPSRAPVAHLHQVRDVGAQLGPTAQPAPGDRHDAGGRLGRVGEHARAVLDVGAADVDLERGDAGAGYVGGAAAALPPTRRRARSPLPSGPRCSPRRARLRRRGQAGRSASSTPPAPGPWRPTLFSMPAPTSCTRGADCRGHGSTKSDFTTTAGVRRGRRTPPSSVP